MTKSRTDYTTVKNTINSILHSSSTFLSAFYTILIYEWFCRIRLYVTMYDAAKVSTPLLAFIPSEASKLDLGIGFFMDFIYAVASAFGIWLICEGLARLPGIRDSRWRKLTRNFIFACSFTLIALTFCAQYGILVFLHAGLTRRILMYAIHGSSPSWYLSFVSPYDVLVLLLIFMIYFSLVWLPDRPRAGVRLAVLLGVSISFVVFGLGEREARARTRLHQAIFNGRNSGTAFRQLDPALATNPLEWMAKYVVFARASEFEHATPLPTMAQRQTVGFVDPAFALSSVIEKPETKTKPGKNLNVVFFLLESIGSKYETGSPEHPGLMPFVEQLSAKGLVLENHFSSGIDTDCATFGIFTGIYALPAAINFEDRKDLRFPTLFSAVGPNYSNTFVTESATKVFYPIHLLRNGGLKEVWDADSLPTESYHLFISTFKDPVETAEFFAKRATSMSEPFVAIYNLYATHSPYFDFDRKGELAASSNSLARYKKDVALVDRQIKMVMDQLKNSGLADHTIVVITSDHGEAFGEHPEDYGHGLYLYNAATHVPMLFYQPNLITPGKMSEITSHVDLLPTLLDLMGIAYDPLQFQGESVLRPQRRKYIFAYGPKNDAIASISRDRVKVIVDLTSNICSAYDLKTDPDELKKLNCASFQQQVDDLLEYRNHQLHFLPNYAASCANALPCAPIKPY